MAGARRMHLPSFISHESFVVQVNPFSIVHVDEQPSPSLLLPSSQSSLSTRPSPQRDVHAPAEQSGSAWQSFEQPSNGVWLPSSHTSAPSALPSPHVVGVHVLGLPKHLK